MAIKEKYKNKKKTPIENFEELKEEINVFEKALSSKRDIENGIFSMDAYEFCKNHLDKLYDKRYKLIIEIKNNFKKNEK